TGDWPVLLVDEPEAFLHPPQARRMGRLLARHRTSGQLFIATHSLDILLGLVSESDGDLSILRVQRPQAHTQVEVLDRRDVKRLWSDPLLQFSRALDGLFHDVTVVCESDSDALFYEQVAEWLAREGRDVAAAQLDVHYTFASGKQRMATIAEALVGVGVPTVVCADFDVLRERDVWGRLVTSLGHEISPEMLADWTVMSSSLNGAATRTV
ncbi:hypothetical protein B7486_72230, partial [cyanobacterium TDX16]